ncbi:hypothetical protein [Streptomyces sp. NBC_00083]|uniref:hypothetical protein n=1 Tax=Streptomyces sp. NBC_00083 TaxID=2975647 RepID=UPI0022510F99|nr:hypothetical protein [Streptomyces sp. NBC_00083]MCX5384522.1 hypothetical protein [Streptomyces sp. NBC_00083]
MSETAKSETAKKNEASNSTAAKSTARSASSGARSATTKAASATTTGAKSATTDAKSAAAHAKTAASQAKAAASDAKDSTGRGVVALRSKAKAGGEKLSAVPGKSLRAATTAWTVVQKRKQIAAGLGGGALAALAGAYSLGRVTARRGHGPFTRATGGRF